jgi:hypothetical protein
MGLSIKLTEAERLLFKLGLERAGDAKDIIWLYRAPDGRPVLRTKISKGRGDMKGHVADKFRGQLKLTESQLRAALDCTTGAEEYRALLRAKGVLV